MADQLRLGITELRALANQRMTSEKAMTSLREAVASFRVFQRAAEGPSATVVMTDVEWDEALRLMGTLASGSLGMLNTAGVLDDTDIIDQCTTIEREGFNALNVDDEG